jgi:hypothetical protein
VQNAQTFIHSFDFTSASVHGVNYLTDVKYNLNSCELIGDRGYISADYQLDFFNAKNQRNKADFSATKRRKR